MKSAAKALGMAAALALLPGCAGIYNHRGAVLDDQLAAAIQPGIDNKDSVAKTLGRPSFTGQFNDSVWYYVARDTKTVAFRNPNVTKQTVLRVIFDQAGNVARVDRTGRELIASVNPEDVTTPTLGRDRGFFDELFGGIGTVGSGGVAPTGGGRPQ